MTGPPGEAGLEASGRSPSPDRQPVAPSPRRSRRTAFAILLAVGFFGAAGGLLSDYALAPFSRPEFCVSCHEMKSAHARWLESPHSLNPSGVSVSCVECHLPSRDDRLAHLAAKGRAGIGHAVAHVLGTYRPEAARETVRRALPNERCIDCHSRLDGSPSSPAVAIVHNTALRRASDRAHACIACHDTLHGPRPAPTPAKTYKSGDNSYCLVCHINFQREPFAVAHVKAGVACSQCHGSSHPHAADEEHLTAPDILFAKAAVNDSCMTADCHPRVRMEAEIGHRPLFAAADPDHPYCTDCHGNHRIPTRTRRWDQATRQLVEAGGTPVTPGSLERASAAAGP